ncbi:MAG: AGE family epimerase/isomerase [Flexilinea sp.]
MQTDLFRNYRKKYSDTLFQDCIPFWMTNGLDKVNGGISTYLDRKGSLYVTDKSVWFQGRSAWIFAHLCNEYGFRQEWKDASLSCLKFLIQHCIDPTDKRMYFMVTSDGKPLRKRRYYFSETFFIMAAAEAGKAFNDPDLLEQARIYYDFLMKIYRNPSYDPYKITPKFYSENRPMRSLAFPMILLNVTDIMLQCDPENSAKYEASAKELADDILKYNFNRDYQVLFETVGENGEFLKDVSLGRTVNPGHSIEASWFLLKQAQKTNDHKLASVAEGLFNRSIELGWDDEFGGIYSFIDILGFPPEQLEHDMKLWWPITEALICSILFYEDTGNQKYFDWFERIDQFAFSKFADPEYGEWYGYLHRDGTPTLPPCKGNLFKGPFHIPRMLIMVERCLSRLENY